ncbi:glycosyltransferase family 4 protein [Flavobacterium plurextorum]|uniref:glycosyltransferase family 4 protein n=1 Tax=Flavobacterium plurextorum TaxID=1114867 RepID=UPI0037563DC5
MKNILIVSAVFSPEPVVSAQISHSLAETLSRKDHNVTVIAPYPSRPLGFNFDEFRDRPNKISTFISRKQLTCFHLPSFVYASSGILGRFRESISFGIESYKFITSSKEKYDIVYMNTWPIFGQLGVTLACIKKKIPYTIHIMDIYPESITKRLPVPLKTLANLLLMPIEKIIIRKAKRVIAISNKMKDHLVVSRKINSDKVSVVYNWQDEDNFNIVSRNEINQKKVFMYLGNIGPVAGIPFLIESFSKVNSKLIIAGSGSYKEYCVKFAQKFPNADVEFVDVPAGKVSEVQAKADVMLLPILKGYANTSIPSKLPAYMFSAKPVLVMADIHCDSASTVLSAKCGWAGEYGDTDWLVNKINDITRIEEEDLNCLGFSGYNYAKIHFSKKHNLNNLETLILS